MTARARAAADRRGCRSCPRIPAAAQAPRHIVHSFAVLLVIIVVCCSNSGGGGGGSFNVAAAPDMNPWALMMQDTERVARSLRDYPDHFAPSSAASAPAAAAAAISLSTSLLSLKARYSNLCTAAYGGYNGAPPRTALK
jgi:hypothetical protein